MSTLALSFPATWRSPASSGSGARSIWSSDALVHGRSGPVPLWSSADPATGQVLHSTAPRSACPVFGLFNVLAFPILGHSATPPVYRFGALCSLVLASSWYFHCLVVFAFWRVSEASSAPTLVSLGISSGCPSYSALGFSGPLLPWHSNAHYSSAVGSLQCSVIQALSISAACPLTWSFWRSTARRVRCCPVITCSGAQPLWRSTAPLLGCSSARLRWPRVCWCSS